MAVIDYGKDKDEGFQVVTYNDPVPKVEERKPELRPVLPDLQIIPVVPDKPRAPK